MSDNSCLSDASIARASELRARRLALRRTQAQLAEELGVTKRTIINWEQGVYPIPHMAFIALGLAPKIKERRRV